MRHLTSLFQTFRLGAFNKTLPSKHEITFRVLCPTLMLLICVADDEGKVNLWNMWLRNPFSGELKIDTKTGRYKIRQSETFSKGIP